MKGAVRALLAAALTAAGFVACGPGNVSVGTAPAAGTQSRPAAAPAPVLPSGGGTRVVLVEAKGPATEVEAFVSRFLSEVSDRSLFRLTDARVAGVRFSDLVTQPDGDTAVAFLKEWPADAYLFVDLPECEVKANSVPFREQDPTSGRYYERVVTTVNAVCTVTLRLADARDGHQMAIVHESGFADFSGARAPEEGDRPEREAAREAARRAAKKLKGAIK